MLSLLRWHLTCRPDERVVGTMVDLLKQHFPGYDNAPGSAGP